MIACALVGTGVFLNRPARAQVAADDAYVPLGPEDLQSLAAPVALYPDAMLAQILVACTYPNDIVAATAYLDAGSDPNGIDDQGWDLSVAGVARYPDLLHYMASNGDWMNSLGAAFLNQQADVMTAVQTLRSQALAAGNLVSNDQQQVVVDQGTIEIIPADPQNIYPPIYDPTLVYQPPIVVVGVVYVPLIHFWHPIRCGVWLHHDLDWRDRTVYVGAWGVDRPWWRHDRDRGPLDYTHDRPGLFVSNTNITVNVHNRVVNVRGGAWNREAHDPQKPLPKYVARPGSHLPSARPGTGYEPNRGPAPRPNENIGGITNYNHATTVVQQSDRGRASLENSRIKPVAANNAQPNRVIVNPHPGPTLIAHPPAPVNVPNRRAVPSPSVHTNITPTPHPAPVAPARAAPTPPRSATVERGGAVGGYNNGAAASKASSRGASSRAPSGPAGKR